METNFHLTCHFDGQWSQVICISRISLVQLSFRRCLGFVGTAETFIYLAACILHPNFRLLTSFSLGCPSTRSWSSSWICLHAKTFLWLLQERKHSHHCVLDIFWFIEEMNKKKAYCMSPSLEKNGLEKPIRTISLFSFMKSVSCFSWSLPVFDPNDTRTIVSNFGFFVLRLSLCS